MSEASAGAMLAWHVLKHESELNLSIAVPHYLIMHNEHAWAPVRTYTRAHAFIHCANVLQWLCACRILRTMLL